MRQYCAILRERRGIGEVKIRKSEWRIGCRAASKRIAANPKPVAPLYSSPFSTALLPSRRPVGNPPVVPEVPRQAGLKGNTEGRFAPAVAAPATVSAETFPTCHWALRPGKAGKPEMREPGNLPRVVTYRSRAASGAVVFAVVADVIAGGDRASLEGRPLQQFGVFAEGTT